MAFCMQGKRKSRRSTAQEVGRETDADGHHSGDPHQAASAQEGSRRGLRTLRLRRASQGREERASARLSGSSRSLRQRSQPDYAEADYSE